MFDNWGYDHLGERFRSESIGEMKDAEQLIERILYSDGHPNVQRLGTIGIGETASEKLTFALDELETDAILRLNRGIALRTERADNGSRELLEDILEGEESHADWLETQLGLVGQIGEAHYLAQQIRG